MRSSCGGMFVIETRQTKVTQRRALTPLARTTAQSRMWFFDSGFATENRGPGNTRADSSTLKPRIVS